MPTPAPCLPTAARVASTSCSRRARRCSSHRESRRSRVLTVSAFTIRTVPDTVSTRQNHPPPKARFWRSRSGDPPMPASTRKAAIVGGNRIPFARSNTAYARASNQDMLTATLDGLVAPFGLQGASGAAGVAGAVLKHSKDFNLTRESVLGSRLAATTPAYDVSQACGTGLETTILVANKSALGQIECGVAGGVDTTSDAPIAVNDDLREVLLELNRARSLGARLKALRGL